MKRILTGILPLVFAMACFAGDDSIVRWQKVTGVITAAGVSNPVAGIDSGKLPWTVSRGRAEVDLTKGDAEFFVEGLVLIGGNSSGTPDGVTSVKGALVCNVGATNQTIIDTPAVPLDAQGSAEFNGSLDSAPPSTCGNPIFLILNAPANVWIATGAVRTTY